MPRGKPFQRGYSGNHGGRPKADPARRALAATHTKETIEGILAIARDSKTPPQVRLNAWSELIDRGHGKPTTPVEVEAQTELKSVTIHIPGLNQIEGNEPLADRTN